MRNEDDDDAAALAHAEAAMDEVAEVVHPAGVAGRRFSGAVAGAPNSPTQQSGFSINPRFVFFFVVFGFGFVPFLGSQFAVADCWIGKPGLQV